MTARIVLLSLAALLTGLAGLLLNTGRVKERYAAGGASVDRGLEGETQGTDRALK